MENENQPEENTTIPNEIPERVNQTVKEMFDLFALHAKRMAEDLAKFNARRQEIEQKVKDGARRTSGRIV